METIIQALSPGYFPFVMATSIMSSGTFLLGPSWLSRALLVAEACCDPGRMSGFFAIAAGTDMPERS